MRISDWSSDVCSSDLIFIGQTFDIIKRSFVQHIALHFSLHITGRFKTPRQFSRAAIDSALQFSSGHSIASENFLHLRLQRRNGVACLFGLTRSVEVISHDMLPNFDFDTQTMETASVKQ